MGDTDPIHLHQHFTRPLQRAQLPPLLLSTRGTSPLNCGVGASTPALVVSLRHSRRRGGRNPSAGWALHVLLRQVLEEQVFSHPSFTLFGELARRGGNKNNIYQRGSRGSASEGFSAGTRSVDSLEDGFGREQHVLGTRSLVFNNSSSS